MLRESHSVTISLYSYLLSVIVLLDSIVNPTELDYLSVG